MMNYSQTLSLVFISFSLFVSANGESLPTIKLTSDEVMRLGISSSPLEQKVVSDPVPVIGELTIDPTRRRSVGSFFGGQLLRDPKQVGEEVEAGEELFMLRSREVGEVIADYLEKAEHLETATVLHEREKGLRAKKLTTEDAYLDAYSAFREARAAQASALQMALLVRSQTELNALREGGLTEQFTDLSLAAPLSGLVIAKMKSTGDAVEANEVLCEIADLSQLVVELRVPLQAMNRARVGDKVAFETVVGDTQRGTASIVRINPVSSGQSLTTTVYATLSNEGGQWLAGTPVKASLVDESRGKKAAAPVGAVVTIDDEPHVFVEEGEGNYRPVPVQLGERSQQLVEVTEGLEPGAKIVSQRASLLLAAYEERTAE